MECTGAHVCFLCSIVNTKKNAQELMSDEIGSGDSLASVVQDASISPADLAIPVHNVALECAFVLSRIAASSDKVIGYKSPVFQDNSLAWGQVWEPSISRNAFP